MSKRPVREFDFIVVGAGSAGCVMARRLADYGTVLVVEAGGSARHPHIDRPADYVKRFETADDWNFATTRQPHLAGRVVRLPRGRGPGGSTRINASIWMEPALGCLQALEADGGPEWSVENLQRALAAVTARVRPETPRWLSDASQRFLAAATEAGYTPTVHTRMNRRGRRHTAADAWLADSPATLTQMTSLCVRRIELRDGQATGIVAGGDPCDEAFVARREVILCCGAVQSPALLWRSGIGPREDLRRAGIDCLIDSRGVGRGLQDHLIMPVIFDVPADAAFPAAWSPRHLARWQSTGTGPIASNLAECGLFAGEGSRKVQVHVTPTDYLRHPSATAAAAITIGVTLSHPRSRGRVWIESPDPSVPPQVDPCYLSDEGDAERMVGAVQLARDLARTEPLRSWIIGERTPGMGKTTDDSLLRSVRRLSQTLYHLVGTCRMGTDADAVVDPQMRVVGVGGLRVVDASILARVPQANPNALVMAVAWAGADHVLRTA